MRLCLETKTKKRDRQREREKGRKERRKERSEEEKERERKKKRSKFMEMCQETEGKSARHLLTFQFLILIPNKVRLKTQLRFQ